MQENSVIMTTPQAEKMRVLLIHPSFDLEEQYGDLGKIIEPMLPLSLGSLGAYLEAQGVSVKVVDEQIEYMHPGVLQRYINEFDPGVVGMTVLTPIANRAYTISQEIKKINRNILNVFGNVHPTLMPDEVLKTGVVDIAVRGEGEYTLWDLVLHHYEGTLKENLPNIQGISYLNDEGNVKHNPNRPYVKNLDVFPPFAYHLLMEDSNNPLYNAGHITTSRGCPWNCIFCSSRTISGVGYRVNSPQRVIEEITTLVEKYNIKAFVFDDDNFIVNKKRSAEICDLIIQKGYHKRLKWHCQGRGDLVSEDILRKMKEAGCVSVSFGIETMSQRLLDTVNKSEKVEDNVKAVMLCKKVGLQSRGSFILGLPTESREECLMTIKLAKKLPLTYAKFSIATPYPGTDLYQVALKEGFKVPDDWIRFTTTVGLGKYEPVYAPKGRTTSELKVLQRWANLTFYLTPKRLIAMFEQNAPQNITTLPKVTSIFKLFKYAKIGLWFLFTTFTLHFKGVVPDDDR